MKKLMVMAALAGAAIGAAQGATYKWSASVKDVPNGATIAETAAIYTGSGEVEINEANKWLCLYWTEAGGFGVVTAATQGGARGAAPSGALTLATSVGAETVAWAKAGTEPLPYAVGWRRYLDAEVNYESGEYLPLPDPEPSPSPESTPEPTSGALVALGAAGLALRRKDGEAAGMAERSSAIGTGARDNARAPREETAELEASCRVCQTHRSGEGYGDDVPPKSGFDDMCDHCETARELRFRMGITQAKEVA